MIRNHIEARTFLTRILGTFLEEGEESDTRAEYDFHITLYSKLQKRHAELEREKNSSAKVKLLKQCRQDQVRVKRVLQKLGHDFDAIEQEQEKCEKAEIADQSVVKVEEEPEDQPVPVKDEKPPKAEPEKSEPEKVLNGNYDVKKDIDNDICPAGPKIEENGNIETNSEHGEKEPLSQSNGSVSSTNGLHDFQPLDLVWAKCAGMRYKVRCRRTFGLLWHLFSTYKNLLICS